MTALRCGYYAWAGEEVETLIPTDPEPEPGYEPIDVPTQPMAAGERWLVRVIEFPGHGDRGLIWDAEVPEPSIKAMEAGGNNVSIRVPATVQNMRILGDPIVGYDQAGRRLYSNKHAIERELVIGSTLSGNAKWRFVIRDPWEQEGTMLTLRGRGIIGGLTADRVIGAPSPVNLLGDALGSFESGDLTGWQLIGSNIDAGVEAGGPDGAYKVWVTGTPDTSNYIQARARYVQPARPWGRQRIAGSALVQLPGYGIDIDTFGLVRVAVYDALTGTEVWPAGADDLEAAIVESDMRRGSFTPEPVTAFGYLPTPPFTADVWVRLYPTDETERTYYDGVQLFRREATSTVSAVDITRHVSRLFEHAQGGRDKSDWGVNYTFPSDAGVVKVGTWWHQDGQSMPDALNAVCAEGCEAWDYPSGGRTVAAAKRRGSRRTDLAIHWWDLLGVIKWQVDPGAQRTAVRATSAAGSVWGGADEGAIDATQSGGQIIDVILSGPVGMTPEQLKAWAMNQLASLRLIQATSTFLVPWKLGQRIGVGDTIRIAPRTGSAGYVDWFRVHGWTPALGQFVALDVGTDPEYGGL